MNKAVRGSNEELRAHCVQFLTTSGGVPISHISGLSHTFLCFFVPVFVKEIMTQCNMSCAEAGFTESLTPAEEQMSFPADGD